MVKWSREVESDAPSRRGKGIMKTEHGRDLWVTLKNGREVLLGEGVSMFSGSASASGNVG